MEQEFKRARVIEFMQRQDVLRAKKYAIIEGVHAAAENKIACRSWLNLAALKKVIWSAHAALTVERAKEVKRLQEEAKAKKQAEAEAAARGSPQKLNDADLEEPDADQNKDLDEVVNGE